MQSTSWTQSSWHNPEKENNMKDLNISWSHHFSAQKAEAAKSPIRSTKHHVSPYLDSHSVQYTKKCVHANRKTFNRNLFHHALIHNYHVMVLIEVFRDCLSIQKVLRTKPLRIVPMKPITDSHSQRYLMGCLLPSLALRLFGLKAETLGDLDRTLLYWNMPFYLDNV